MTDSDFNQAIARALAESAAAVNRAQLSLRITTDLVERSSQVIVQSAKRLQLIGWSIISDGPE